MLSPTTLTETIEPAGGAGGGELLVYSSGEMPTAEVLAPYVR